MGDRALLDQVEVALRSDGIAYDVVVEADGTKTLHLTPPPQLGSPFTSHVKVSKGDLVLVAKFLNPVTETDLDLSSHGKRDAIQAYANAITPRLKMANVILHDGRLYATASAALNRDLRQIVIGGCLYFQKECAQVAVGLVPLMSGLPVNECVAFAEKAAAFAGDDSQDRR